MSNTAEWKCTKCGATNRQIVRPGANRSADRCFTCRTPHRIERDERPAQWTATATA